MNKSADVSVKGGVTASVNERERHERLQGDQIPQTKEFCRNSPSDLQGPQIPGHSTKGAEKRKRKKKRSTSTDIGWKVRDSLRSVKILLGAAVGRTQWEGQMQVQGNEEVHEVRTVQGTLHKSQSHRGSTVAKSITYRVTRFYCHQICHVQSLEAAKS